MRAAALIALLLTTAASPALASEERPTLAELEPELVCPTCETTLDMSDAPVADRMREFIRERIAAGETKSEIKAQLVADFGESVLASPPRRGFDLLAWALPLAGLLAAGSVVGVAAWRWSRAQPSGEEPPGVRANPSVNGRGSLDPELERRLEEELARFDG